MKTLLSIIIVLTLPCLCLNAKICPGPTSHSETDSTGTGGSLPDMGWDNQSDSNSLQVMLMIQDTLVYYDLFGKKTKVQSNQIVIQNKRKKLIK